MKRLLLILAIALTWAVTGVPRLSAQSAMFIYSGVPVTPVQPGSSFTVGLSVQAVTGGTIQDVHGLSFWMAQSIPAGGPFPFQITNRSMPPGGCCFIDVYPPDRFPHILDPINRNPNGTQTSTDLGGRIPIGQPGLPTGTHFIANLTFKVLPGAVPGSYTLRNTTPTIPGVGGRISVFNDSEGDIAPISASPFTVTVGTPYSPTQVVSRTSHSGVPFDIDLPLTGNSGIECRSGGAIAGYQVVFSFANPVTFNNAAITAGVGTVNSTSGSGTTAVTVSLANVNNAQWITVRLSGVSDGTNTSDFSVPMGVLVGDSNGDGVVNAGDTLQARNRSGQVTDAANFRTDVNLDGFVNSGDFLIVRSHSGTFLP